MIEANSNKRLFNIIIMIIMIIIAILFGLYSVHLGIDSENDSYNYHFYNGFAFINNRTFTDLAPAGLHSYFNPFLDVLVYLGITTLPQKIYAFIVGFIQGLNIIPIYFISKKLLSRFSLSNSFILVLSCIGLFHSLFLAQLGVAMHDSLTSLFVLFSFVFVLYFYKKNNTLGFYMPSLLVGCVVGLKLTTAIYGLSIAFIITIYSLYIRNYKVIIYSGLFMVGGFLLTNGWWMYQLWSHFQNPFYPYLNNIFKSTLAVTDAAAYIDEYFFRQKGLQKLFYPIFFSNEPGMASGYFGWPLHSFYREVVSYILVIVVLLCMCSYKWRIRRKSYFNSKYILFFSFCAFSYVIWYLKFGVLRYLMPILLIAPTIIVTSLFLLLFEKTNNNNLNMLLNMGKKSKTILKLNYNFIFIVFLLFCSLLSYKDLKNGFPMDAHRTITGSSFILENPLSEYDNEASVYFITGTPRVWQAWIFPALDLKGLAVPLKSGIFHYENENLLQKRISIVNENLSNNGYAVVVRDLTGQGWISQPTSDDETNQELKPYNLKLSNDCREYDSGFGSNIHRLKFCSVEPL